MSHFGIDKDRFVNLPFDQFDCIICSEVVLDPVECDVCGRLFCKMCINDWMSKNPATHCPNRCNSKIKNVTSKALLKVYNSLRIRCSNPNCLKEMNLGDLKLHEDRCLKPKCWNFQVCEQIQDNRIQSELPVCSILCEIVHQLSKSKDNKKKQYQILSSYLKSVVGNQPQQINPPSSFQTLCWDPSRSGTGI